MQIGKRFWIDCETKPAGTPRKADLAVSQAAGTTIIAPPFGRPRQQIVGTIGDCERLRQCIAILQRALVSLERTTREQDRRICDERRDQIEHLNQLLIQKLEQLARIDKSLWDWLRGA